MGLFFADDSSYDESVRLTGFDRYRQLLSFNAGIYFKVNFLTILGALPLAAGITYSVLSSSVLLLIPFSVIGRPAAGSTAGKNRSEGISETPCSREPFSVWGPASLFSPVSCFTGQKKRRGSRRSCGSSYLPGSS